MRKVVLLVAVLGGLALPAGAKPVEPNELALMRQTDVRPSEQRGRPESRDRFSPKPLAAELDAVVPPVRAVRGAARTARTLVVIPWQTGVFQ
jgi:hypothetical protein